MNNQFDEVAKGLAESISWWRVLRHFGVGLAGVLRTMRGAALTLALLVGIRDQAVAQARFFPGIIKQEIYSTIEGVNVSNLTASPKFPGSPDDVRYVPRLEMWSDLSDPPPSHVRDNYGVRLSGLLTPKETATYNFYLAADDNGEFWLSTGANPANKRLLAFEPRWAHLRHWTGDEQGRRPGCDSLPPNCENVSSPIALIANQSYYFEALAKQSGGGDNLAVTWTKLGEPPPINGLTPPIGSAYLGVVADNTPSIQQSPSDTFVAPGASAFLFVLTRSTPEPLSYQWFKEDNAIDGATKSSYQTPPLTLADSASSYHVVVQNSDGRVISQTARVAVSPSLPVAWQLVRGPGGNLYGFVLMTPDLWDDARVTSEALGFRGQRAHLTTITSATEDIFLENLRVQFVVQSGLQPSGVNEFWVGGFQLANQRTPRDGWLWVNNEGPFPGFNGAGVYADWAAGEPNDCCSPTENNEENHLAFGRFNTRGWNDEGSLIAEIHGHGVEFEVIPPETRITSALACSGGTISDGAATLSRSITLAVAGTDDSAVVGFEYSLDNAPYLPCGDRVSLSALALGEHVLQVRAIDDADNPDPTPARFAWTVVTPAETISSLANQVQGLMTLGVLNPGQGNALMAKLDVASKQLEHSHPKTATNVMRAFLNQVRALVRARILSPEQATPLLIPASELVNSVDNPNCDSDSGEKGE